MVSLTGFMSVPLMSLFGWSVFPDFATKQLLAFFHRSFQRTPPQPNTRAYHQHYAVTFALVVLGYLSYNLVSSARAMQPNFYQILGVPPAVDEAGLKSAFRQFAKKNHPDRPGVGRHGEELFIMVRDVYEALKDPVVRFAYDRFGPDVLLWTHCSTTRDYIRTGLVRSSGYHIVVGAALVFWSLVGSESPVSFWRYTLYASLFAAEISLILSPTPSSSPPTTSPFSTTPTFTTHTILHTLFPHRITHQHVLFLHQLFLFLSIALSRVVPVLLSAFSSQSFSQISSQEHRQLAERLAGLSAIADREVTILMNTVLHSIASPAEGHETVSSLARPRPFELPNASPFATPASSASPPSYYSDVPSPGTPTKNTRALQILMKEMEDLIIEANIKKEDGPLRSLWEMAVERGRIQPNYGQSTPERNGRKSVFWEADVVEPTEVKREEGRGTLSSLSRPTLGSVRFPSFTGDSQMVVARARSVSC